MKLKPCREIADKVTAGAFSSRSPNEDSCVIANDRLSLLARVREKIEAARKPYYAPNVDHDEGIDDALRAVDEVEKEGGR